MRSSLASEDSDYPDPILAHEILPSIREGGFFRLCSQNAELGHTIQDSAAGFQQGLSRASGLPAAAVDSGFSAVAPHSQK